MLKTIPSRIICNEVHYAKGCNAPGFCYYGPRVHNAKDCRPAECQSCSTIISILELNQDMPKRHDARNCPCVPYKKLDERKKMTKKKADKLCQEYILSGDLAIQIEIEKVNENNNIWSTNINLYKPAKTMRKINIHDLFTPLKDSICPEIEFSRELSYADALLLQKGGYEKGGSLAVTPSEDTPSVDKSDEVKSIRILLKKFQDLKEVWTDTGNGTEEEFRKINECILSLTDELNKIV
jgi:hypothetical protein